MGYRADGRFYVENEFEKMVIRTALDFCVDKVSFCERLGIKLKPGYIKSERSSSMADRTIGQYLNGNDGLESHQCEIILDILEENREQISKGRTGIPPYYEWDIIINILLQSSSRKIL